MLVFGLSLFSYKGNLNDVIRDLGEYSIVFWLPILIFGVIITKLSKIIKTKK